MSGRYPPSYCTLTLIAMQRHQQKGRQNNTSSNKKDKYKTIIETRTAEDDDDENLHNPETVQDAVIHLEVDEELIVLMAHFDLFDQSSSPPERNIKWPKTGGS